MSWTRIAMTLGLLAGLAPAQAQRAGAPVPSQKVVATSDRASMVKYRGVWMRKYDAVRLQYQAELQRRRKQLERTLNRHFRAIASRSAVRRDKGLAAIEKIAERREKPRLAGLARSYHTKCVRFWESYRVLASVNATHSQLLGLPPFTTSLGAGSPVTLQLPRTVTTSVGTSVLVPAGR